MRLKEIMKMIDHTALKPEVTTSDIIRLCDEAKTYHVASVCVNTAYASLAAEQLKDTDIKVCVVVGFPLGANISDVKAFEATKAIEAGATEVDMVINVGALKEKKYDYVKQDIKGVVDAVNGKAILKVILETCLLTNEEIVKACELSVEAGADFVKTSTGFSTGGAKEEHIRLMRETVGTNVGVKASGGIRSKETAEKMIEAGANRLGVSSTKTIYEGGISASDY
ncbi:deoxyribose-phosphate aldolase [Clostridiaceae bacterium M8S5]|nr:deoxyribose-phosphate aldolase [Clostridiaceae bacterium M8S5]